MQVPIINGIYMDDKNYRVSYPINMVPVVQQSGISNGYIKPAEGIVDFNMDGVTFSSTKNRGGINWDGVCYRVQGGNLNIISSNKTVTYIGDVELNSFPGVPDFVTLDYGPDRLMIVSNGKLFYYIPASGLSVTQVTDGDLGVPIDGCFLAGYYITTDGDYIIVTDLNDPTAINPLKYGSSEADPDKIKALIPIRNELIALNRHTIEFFGNIGGDLFPLQRIEGAQIQKGTVGTHTCCIFQSAVAFLGSGRGPNGSEPLAVYIGANGDALKISTREIDILIRQFTEDELSRCLMESRIDLNHEFLYLHLPDRTLVYDAATSRESGEQVWFVLTSDLGDNFSQYRARNLVWCYNKWLCEDSETSRLGSLSNDVHTHYDELVRWEFGTVIIYNETAGAILHDLRLTSLTGSNPIGTNPQISTSYSEDGISWSQDFFIKIGVAGERNKMLCWLQQGYMSNQRIQRFRGDSSSALSFSRLDTRIEGLGF